MTLNRQYARTKVGRVGMFKNQERNAVGATPESHASRRRTMGRRVLCICALIFRESSPEDTVVP